MHNATVEMTEIKISVENQPWKDINDRILHTSASSVDNSFKSFNSFWCNLHDVNARLRLDVMTESTVKGTKSKDKNKMSSLSCNSQLNDL